jgi:tryptophan synthase alpha chain
MSRLTPAFDRLRSAGRGGLVAYFTAGDPDGPRSADLMIAAARAGADVLEVGVPFSDPVADGPVIQRATERALAAGMTLRGALDVVRRVREAVDVPIVLFTYANPVLRLGAERFAADAAAAGADGVLMLDYPIEEAGPLRGTLVAAGLDPIFLVSPTTTDERMRESAEEGRGFLYAISRLGVTGARSSLAADLAAFLGRVRRASALPVAVGFGISHPDHVVEACRGADAAVVGSALVDVVARHGRSDDLSERVSEQVRWLKSGL